MTTLLIICILVTLFAILISHLFTNAESKFVANVKLMVVPLGLITIFITWASTSLGAWSLLLAFVFLIVSIDSFRQGIIQNILLSKCYPISKYEGWYKIKIDTARELPFALTEKDEKKLKDEIAKRESDWDPNYY